MGHASLLQQLLCDESSTELKDYKLSLSVYSKSFYRTVQSDGYNNIDIPGTMKHIELLFMCFESTALELKSKYSIFGALE